MTNNAVATLSLYTPVGNTGVNYLQAKMLSLIQEDPVNKHAA